MLYIYPVAIECICSADSFCCSLLEASDDDTVLIFCQLSSFPFVRPINDWYLFYLSLVKKNSTWTTMKIYLHWFLIAVGKEILICNEAYVYYATHLMCISFRIAWKPLSLLSKDNKTLKFLCLNYHRSSYLFFSYFENFNILPSVGHLLASILDYSKFVEMSIVLSSFFTAQPKIFVFYTVS